LADWDQRYRAGEHSPAEPHQLLVAASEILTPGHALDLACGAGRHAIYLAKQGWRVTAVDSSREGLQIVQRRALEAGVEVNTVASDLEAREFDIAIGAYDLICVFYYLQRDLFEAIKQGLRTDGSFVGAIHVRQENPGSETMNPKYLLEPGELKTFFAGWQINHYHEGKHGGAEHKHRDAEIIARKS
jgi:tellurite methyltransferase